MLLQPLLQVWELDLVARNVEEERLARDRLELWREGDERLVGARVEAVEALEERQGRGGRGWCTGGGGGGQAGQQGLCAGASLGAFHHLEEGERGVGVGGGGLNRGLGAAGGGGGVKGGQGVNRGRAQGAERCVHMPPAPPNTRHLGAKALNPGEPAPAWRLPPSRISRPAGNRSLAVRSLAVGSL